MATVRTFCRICEPSCGLLATVTDGAVTDLSPDREHPVTRGYACHKGLAALDIHRDPDRLDTPQRRRADGTWEAIDWDTAMSDIASRLDALRQRHGRPALAMYIGNPLAFNALGQLHVGALAQHLGVGRTFSSGTQDCANKFVASEAVFGSRNVHPIPDLGRTDLCLIIGENPRASQASFFSIPNVLGELRAATARGARILFVNPRRIETPDRGVGDTLLIRPDTDLYFLASLLHEIDRLDGFDRSIIARHGRNIEGLRRFLAGFPPQRTAEVTGIPEATVTELASAWIAAEAPSVHASTGLNMGRQGTLAYWLVHMLAFVTGRLGAEGGNLKSDGFYPNARAGAGSPAAAYVDTEWGPLRRGPLPGTLLSHAILDADDPVRALIVVAGNPLLSIAGEGRLRKAFEQLELLVVIDLYRNATAELGHYVLPATDELEREDLNVVNIGTSYRPWVQYTPAVVAPAGQRRPEWWIAHRLLRELGAPSLLDGGAPADHDADHDGVGVRSATAGATADPWAKYRYMLSKGAAVEFDDLRSGDPVVLPEPEPGRFFADHVATDDGLVDCCPDVFAPAIDRADEIFTELAQEPDRLKLITRRDAWTHNSWFANLPRMKRGGRDTNPLWMHPVDADRHGLADGDGAVVTSEHGEVIATVRLADDLMRSVVSMLHGWGHANAPAMREAAARPGVNVNALLPIGDGSYEPLSSQAHMTGIPVDVRRAR